MQTVRRFANAPVTEMTLTVSFGPVFSGLTMLDVADLFQQYQARYPYFQHLPIAQPMFATAQPAGPIFAFGQPAPELPRAMFGAADLQTSIYFQFDRLSVDWRRQAPLGTGDTYPGYEAMLERLIAEIDVLRAWAKSRGLPDLLPQVGELAYSNAFELLPGGIRRSLADIFTFYRNSRQAEMHAFNCNWTEPLNMEQTEGYLNAVVQSTLLNDGQTGAIFNLLGLINMAGTDWISGQQLLSRLHDRIAEVFDGTIQPEVLQKA